ncbi:ATP-binding protein [Accumulibacter sp.]|uniref:ATP-binding protein n=1 Tax=Accumulibacter sp. TaxID=2053492 RepID=UPI003445BAE8
MDDGAGIPGNTIKHIFEPFFTTRMGQGGSDLGLYIVSNRVSSPSAVSIRVENCPGEGTSFTLTLPMTAPMRLVSIPAAGAGSIGCQETLSEPACHGPAWPPPRRAKCRRTARSRGRIRLESRSPDARSRPRSPCNSSAFRYATTSSSRQWLG